MTVLNVHSSWLTLEVVYFLSIFPFFTARHGEQTFCTACLPSRTQIGVARGRVQVQHWLTKKMSFITSTTERWSRISSQTSQWSNKYHIATPHWQARSGHLGLMHLATVAINNGVWVGSDSRLLPWKPLIWWDISFCLSHTAGAIPVHLKHLACCIQVT